MATKVSPIPKGFRTLTPCLTVNNVEQAISFYEQAFDAEETLRLVAADEVRIVHAELKIGNSTLLIVEENPALGLISPTGAGGAGTLSHLYVANVDAVWEQALVAGASEVVALQDTYWGDRFGKVRDPFGHFWSVASRIERVTRQELVERVKNATSVTPLETVQAGIAA